MRPLSFAAFLLAAACVAVPTELRGQIPARPADVESPEALLTALYDTFQRAPGETMDWDRFRSLYAPDAILVPNVEQTGGEWRIMRVDDFIEWIEAIFAEHSPIGSPQDHGLAEDQVHYTMERYGDVVLVMSTYERHPYNSDEIDGRGINAITLVQNDGRWWITSVAWDEESGAGPIPAQYQPGDPRDAGTASGGWPHSTPAAEGLDPTPLEAVDAAVRAGRYGYVDALLVARDGRVVLDERYEQDYAEASEGRDMTPHQYNYRHPDYHPFPHGGDVHTLQSVTKSITASLIGIAIERGEIEGVDTPIMTYLDAYEVDGSDARLANVTIGDLLTMRTGIEWHELDRPPDSTNTTIQLEGSDDWVRFTLDQPMDADPGAKWVYNSGTSHLMSAILRSATGRTADRYAEEHLFGPLGIDDYHWKRTPTGLPDTEGGLYLETSDLARFGQLFLNGGTWEGRRILPADWVDASVARHVEGVNDQGWGYGYQWWRLDRDGADIWAGLGYGGQYLLVMPDLEMVGIANSWNLFGPADEELLPALIDAMLRAAGAGS